MNIHVAAAVPLVPAKLMVYTGQADEKYYESALARLDKYYRKVLGRNKVNPTTDSLLNPTLDSPNDIPEADRSQFRRYIGHAPAGQNQGDSSGQRTTTD